MKKILLSLLLAFVCTFSMACSEGKITDVTEAATKNDTVKETENANNTW